MKRSTVIDYVAVYNYDLTDDNDDDDYDDNENDRDDEK